MAANLAVRVGDRVSSFIDRLRGGQYNRFLRFAVVGGSGVIVNEGFAWVGLSIFSSMQSETLRDSLAVILGIVVSIFTNFALNDIWTWGDRPKLGIGHWFQRMGQYFLIATFAGAVQWLVTFSLHTWVFNWHLLITNCFGIAAAIIINYHFNNRWTFRDRSNDSPDQ